MINYCQMTKFSDWLTSQLSEREMSPAELSRLMGKDQGIVSRILSGEREPSNDTLKSIIDALNIPPEAALRAIGLLGPGREDPWVEEMAHKMGKLNPTMRPIAEKLLDTLVDQEQSAGKPKSLKTRNASK